MKPLVIDANVWVAAADDTDAFCERSRAFLAAVAEAERPAALPEHAQVEIACALARRLRNPERARILTRQLLRSPLLSVHPLDRSLLERATDVGTRDLLRAGDAFYVALAVQLGGDVISWDAEVVEKGRAHTPTGWLDRNPGAAPEEGPESGDRAIGEGGNEAEA